MLTGCRLRISAVTIVRFDIITFNYNNTATFVYHFWSAKYDTGLFGLKYCNYSGIGKMMYFGNNRLIRILQARKYARPVKSGRALVLFG